MFDRMKENAKYKEIKQHVDDNKLWYVLGAGIAAGVVGRSLYHSGPVSICNDVAPVFNNTPVISPVIAPVFHNTLTNIGRQAKVVKRLEDEKFWEKSIEAARQLAEEQGITLERAKWLISRNANGHLDHVYGMHYQNVATHTLG